MRHVEFCAKLYRLQVSEGRYFIHEHPDRATSWRLPQIEALRTADGMWEVRTDLCMHGLTTVKQGKTCTSMQTNVVIDERVVCGDGP